MLGFTTMADAQSDSINDEARPKAHWRQSDVKRAIGAAEQAGLRFYRVEIATDGTISIVVGAAPEATANPQSGLLTP
jgi:hypothetical protein